MCEGDSLGDVAPDECVLVGSVLGVASLKSYLCALSNECRYIDVLFGRFKARHEAGETVRAIGDDALRLEDDLLSLSSLSQQLLDLAPELGDLGGCLLQS